MSRRRMDEEKKRQVIELYRNCVQKTSIHKVPDQMRMSYTSVWRILVSNNEVRSSRGRPEIYPKTDFTGDLAEQARILGFTEDCGTQYDGKQIRVETSTTHPAQIKLFNDIFGRYGHISRPPCYNRTDSFYYWRVYVYLKRSSFDFVTEYKKEPTRFLDTIAQNGYEIVSIASLTDAEGYVTIHANNGYPRTNLSIINNNRQLLEFTVRTIGGYVIPCGDSYQLRLHGKETVEVLRKLPMMHEEKVAAKELILRHYDNGGIGPEALREYRELRRRIDEEVEFSIFQARLEWIKRHGKPHKDDLDQSIPSI